MSETLAEILSCRIVEHRRKYMFIFGLMALPSAQTAAQPFSTPPSKTRKLAPNRNLTTRNVHQLAMKQLK